MMQYPRSYYRDSYSRDDPGDVTVPPDWGSNEKIIYTIPQIS